MIHRILFAVAGLVLLFTTGAAAESPLTTDQAKRFIATLAPLDALGDELEAQGKVEAMQVDTAPKAGEAFAPYTKAVAALKDKFPGDYAKLAKVAKAQNFSAEEWGAVGDRVMIAYMALKMREQDPKTTAMMQGMDKSMLDMVPPDMRAQLEQTFAMMETVKNAPEADIAAITPLKADLETYMNKQSKD